MPKGQHTDPVPLDVIESMKTMHDDQKEARAVFTFALWAFSDQGFPCLEVLAWGDFTEQKYLKGDKEVLLENKDVWHFIVARNFDGSSGAGLGARTEGFHLVEVEDLEAAAPSVDRPLDFLRACDPTFPSDGDTE